MKKTIRSKPWFASVLGQASVIATAAIVPTISLVNRANATEQGVSFRIWVANYAKVLNRELSRAEAIAASIFHDAGIAMVWLDTPLDGIHLESKYDVHPGDIFVVVLRQAALGTFSAHELGFAIPCPEPKAGCRAYVSYGLVEEVALDKDVSKSEILGAAMAHEIGHILLGPGHSFTGIMKPRWNRHDLRGVGWQQLRFTAVEAEELRAVAQHLRNGVVGRNGKR